MQIFYFLRKVVLSGFPLFVFLWGMEMVKVNGVELALDGMKISDYLSSAQYDMKRIAVEVNGNIIPKTKYSDTVLHEKDQVEIVSFVGGG